MRFDNIQQLKNISATILLLVLLVASSDASPLRECGEKEFFDIVARSCTNCDDICNPSRGTPYLCDQYANDCRPAREYRNSFTCTFNTFNNLTYLILIK